MAKKPLTMEQAMLEIEDLRARLEEAEEALDAIRSGQVDAVVVSGPEGEQIYTLTGAERAYRILVEAMNEGALVLSPEGIIVYSNRTFAAMLGTPIYEVLGQSIYDFVAETDVESLKRMLQEASLYASRKEVSLKHNASSPVPAFISVGSLETEDEPAVSAVVTDLTETKRTEAELAQYREHLEELVMERTRKLAEANEQLRESEEHYRTLFEAIDEGFCIIEMIFDENGKPVDYRFLEVNPAFERQTGLADAQGKRIRELVPKHKDYWFETYGEIALTGQPARFERFAEELHRWYDVYAFRFGRPENRQVAILFNDINERKEFEHRQRELFEREHKISDTLQKALIPSQIPYDLRGVSVAARYQPALREAEVGGDFYDVFKLNENKIAVLIGDVAGKGLNAAIRVAEIRHAVRSYAFLGHNPSEVMALANEALLYEDADMEHILTAFFAVLDTSTGVMAYVCAGHEPPVVYSSHGLIEELEVTGTMLGVMRGVSYSVKSRTLNPGDTVVMFTDGITEARRSGTDLFGKQGVVEYLTKLYEAAPDEVAEGLLSAAVAYAGGSSQDDIAIVVLKVM